MYRIECAPVEIWLKLMKKTQKLLELFYLYWCKKIVSRVGGQHCVHAVAFV